jgi:hypothetical protein
MIIFIAYPVLALAVAAVFLALHARSRRRLVLGAGLAWLAYGAYEFGMQQRWLCTGECNIRIDLLLLYPILALLSVAALVVALRTPRTSRT